LPDRLGSDAGLRGDLVTALEPDLQWLPVEQRVGLLAYQNTQVVGGLDDQAIGVDQLEARRVAPWE
jgi:hypothetical protein